MFKLGTSRLEYIVFTVFILFLTVQTLAIRSSEYRLELYMRQKIAAWFGFKKFRY